MLFSIKNSSFYAFITMLSIAFSSHAYIYQIDAWEKRDNKGRVTQQLYCLSDIHGLDFALSPEERLSHNKVEQEQRTALLTTCSTLKKNKSLFIIEDTGSIADIKHPKVGLFVSLNKKAQFDQPLGSRPLLIHYLGDLLREEKHNVVNAETRQIRTGAISVHHAALPYKENTETFQKIIAMFAPTNQEIAQEFKDSMALIRTFCTTDGPVLKQYYTKALTELDKTMSMADVLYKTAGYYHDFVDYCAGLPTSIPAQFVQGNLLKWAADLIDINTLHHIYQASRSGYHKICCIMGASHIYNVSMILPSLGYKKIKTIGTNPLLQKELNTFVNRTARAHHAALRFIVDQNSISETELLEEIGFEEMTALAQKLIQAKPITNTDFNVITERKNKRAKKGMFNFTLV